ncbi:MAG TPA: histidine phosphatase family protein [Kiritimatiellia bacterium]|nr:histidine phosphatase family protein [Kiritimatiellia bacterium]
MSDDRQSFYFVRHGQREDFVDPGWKVRAARPHDPPLSTLGHRQASDVARALRGQGITALYSSPFLRTLQTAAPVAEALDLPIRLEPAFSEWLNPDWFTQAPDLPDATAARPQFPRVDLRHEPLRHARFPEAAESREVWDRVGHALREIVRRTPGEHVAIVTHGSPLGQAFGFLIPRTEGVHYEVAAITRIDRAGDAFRLVHSGIGHLREADISLRFH